MAKQTPYCKIVNVNGKRMPRFDIDVNETYQVFQTYAPEGEVNGYARSRTYLQNK